MPVGRSVASRPPDCPVREERLSPREAQDRYQQVGVICYAGWRAAPIPASGQTESSDVFRTPPAPPKPADQAARDSVVLVDDVRGEVCRLGGEIVVRQGFCKIGKYGHSVEMGVYATTPSALSRDAVTSGGSPSP